ncbi:MAG: hypothetical protein KatS3mg015_2679 [Fimbriimonadales bacterium]|nr:MAG: hypothetical protein KatS3mg015_2679 [Fimbriimonadales bacterium]
MKNSLLKYAGEFIKALTSYKYERTGDERGLYFPKAKAFISGTYIHDVNGQDERQDPNLLPDEGLIYLLSVGLNNGTKIPTWYLSLYAANYTPLPGLTAASYPATASEITSSTEGYIESTRPVWTPTAPTTPLIDNLANKAAFTIATASSLTVNGAALLSEATKGAVTGKLISATKFSSPRTLYNTDVFNLAYRVQLTST